MTRRLSSLLVAVPWMLAATQAGAATLFSATLLGASERPTPVVTAATGSGALSLSDDQNSLSLDLTFSGLSGPPAAGHIHCCAGPEDSAGVAVGFPSFSTSPYSQVFDLTSAAIYNSSFLTSNGGTAAGARGALLGALAAGTAYLNVHTASNPGGEIRGQVVPEPGPLGLLAAGLGGLLYMGRRQPPPVRFGTPR